MTNSNHFTIRKATEADLNALKTLADAHKHELGFILRSTLAKSIVRQEIFVATQDTELIGFIDYHHRQDTQTTLYHIVVTPERRKQGIGKELIEALKIEVVQLGKVTIFLKCPQDLSANTFYSRLGFNLVSSQNGRRRKLNVWQLSNPTNCSTTPNPPLTSSPANTVI